MAQFLWHSSSKSPGELHRCQLLLRARCSKTDAQRSIDRPPTTQFILTSLCVCVHHYPYLFPTTCVVIKPHTVWGSNPPSFLPGHLEDLCETDTGVARIFSALFLTKNLMTLFSRHPLIYVILSQTTLFCHLRGCTSALTEFSPIFASFQQKKAYKNFFRRPGGAPAPPELPSYAYGNW